MCVGLANYPKGFRGCVVSPTKICLQFEDVQVKARRFDREEAKKVMIQRNNKNPELPIETTGTDIEVTAVGCQMPTLEQMQIGLIGAYAEYYRTNREVYQQTYDRDFRTFLVNTYDKLGDLIKTIDLLERVE